LTYTFKPVPGASLDIRGVTWNAAAQSYFYIDNVNITVNSTSSTATITPIYIYDEYTESLLASGSLTNTLYDAAGTPTAVNSAPGTSLITVYAFDSTLARHSVALNGITRTFYPKSGEINRVAVNGTQQYTVAVIDSSDTFGAGTHLTAIREFGGYNVTCEDRVLSWAKLCYPYFRPQSYYVLTLTSPDGETFVFGNVSAFDNPMYIQYTGSGIPGPEQINGTMLVPQNISIIPDVNMTAPTEGLGPIITALSNSEFGSYALLCLPALIMLVAGRQFGAMAGALASGLCVVVNVSMGLEFYSYSVLGWIAALVLLMVFNEIRAGGR